MVAIQFPDFGNYWETRRKLKRYPLSPLNYSPYQNSSGILHNKLKTINLNNSLQIPLGNQNSKICCLGGRGRGCSFYQKQCKIPNLQSTVLMSSRTAVVSNCSQMQCLTILKQYRTITFFLMHIFFLLQKSQCYFSSRFLNILQNRRKYNLNRVKPNLGGGSCSTLLQHS